MTKNLQDLPNDIDKLFFEGAQIDNERLNTFLSNVGRLIQDRLTPRPPQEPTLRMSKLGIPDRKLWFEHHIKIDRTLSKNGLKFLYGDLIEQLIIFLAKEAGHEVKDEQKEVTLDGIVGHQDGIVDGITVDVKSASSFAFKKFKNGTLAQDDPFGYVAQLSGYSHCNAPDHADAAFIAVNKENGEICILPLDQIDKINPPTRIARCKEVIAMQAPPQEKCYPPEPYQKSGNMTLNKNCGYCQFKDLCWSDANGGRGLRKFRYSTGIVDLVEVSKEPSVEEVLSPIAVGETE